MKAEVEYLYVSLSMVLYNILYAWSSAILPAWSWWCNEYHECIRAGGAMNTMSASVLQNALVVFIAWHSALYSAHEYLQNTPKKHPIILYTIILLYNNNIIIIIIISKIYTISNNGL
jgi:hypothetical protein